MEQKEVIDICKEIAKKEGKQFVNLSEATQEQRKYWREA